MKPSRLDLQQVFLDASAKYFGSLKEWTNKAHSVPPGVLSSKLQELEEAKQAARVAYDQWASR